MNYFPGRILCLAFAGLLVLSCGGQPDRGSDAPTDDAVAQTPRMILLISIDTLRADHLPTYGYDSIETPAIEALALESVVFEQAFTHVPLTLPAHASLLTGLLPYQHGVRSNVGFRLDERHSTLARDLKQAGYATGGAVSSAVLRAGTGIANGFDFFDDAMTGTDPGTHVTEIQRAGMETVQRSLGWLETIQQPGSAAGSAEAIGIFLFVHLYEPHAPYAPPSHYMVSGRTPYDGEVAYSDEILGQLFSGLRRLGLYEPSLIILVSDHGEALGDHGESDHGVFLYREVMRVPLIIKLPEGRSGGRRVEQAVQLVDLAPTVRDWAGLGGSSAGPGTSLLPVLVGSGLPEERQIYAESMYPRLHFGWKELYSLTNGGYSYILAPREELYDTRHAPEQLENLVPLGAHPGGPEPGSNPAHVYASMRAELLSHVNAASLEAGEPISEEEAAKLRALGYFTSSAGGENEAIERPDPKDRIGDLDLYRQAIRIKNSALMARLNLWPKIIGLLQTVAQGSPRMVDAWDELSYSLQRTGRVEEAREALENSIRLDSHRPYKLFDLAEILISLERFDEARNQLTVASRMIPGESHIRIAVLEAERGNPEAARLAAREAGKSIPGAYDFIEGVLLYQVPRYAEAMSLFQQVVGAIGNPSDLERLPHIYEYLGGSIVKQIPADGDSTWGRLQQEAERYLLRELELHPENGRALESLCSLYGAQGRAENGARHINIFVHQNPSPEGYSSGARALRSLKMTSEATALEDRARALQASRNL
jgi:tetratricopeptide (TPR) repeat protein